MKIVDIFEGKEDFIAKQQGQKILAAYEKDSGVKPKMQTPNDPISIIKYIAQTDRLHVQWLVNQYIKGAYKLEDLDRLKKYLIKFNQIKSSLPEQKRDLNSYKLLTDLYDVVRQAEDTEKQEIEAQNQKGRNFIQKDDASVIHDLMGVSIITPHSEEASCYFGTGTEWCTADPNEDINRFDHYNIAGNLYILTTRNGTKYQLYFPSQSKLDNIKNNKPEFVGDYMWDGDSYVDSDGDPVNIEEVFPSKEEIRDKDDVIVTIKQIVEKHPETRIALLKLKKYRGK